MRPEYDWHALQVADAVAAVESDPASGLSNAEAARRLAELGPNALPEPPRRSLLRVFAAQFKNPLISLLLAATVLAFLLGERTDAIVILVVVTLNALIGTVQEGRAERAVMALRRLAQNKARILREGHELSIEARDVVKGDVLLLEAGDAVAADARMLRGAALQIAEAALTGEALPVAKEQHPLAPGTPLADRSNMVYAGTHVTAGHAHAVVVSTGLDTEIGRIATLTESIVRQKTPLERRVDRFGRYILIAATLIFIVAMALGLLRGVPFVQMLMIGVSTLVGMIPEGLPVAMTVALAVGVQRMAQRKAIVRRLSSVETLGSTTVICTDKTGTLTCNEMTVTAIHFPNGQQVTVSGVGYAPEGSCTLEGHEIDANGDARLRTLLEAAVLCNDAQLDGPDQHHANWRPMGDPTEIALLTVAIKAGLIPAEVRTQFRRIAELPFDPAVKMMATQHQSPEGPLVLIKGAPETLLELCDKVNDMHGPRPLDEPTQRALSAASNELAARALRLLGFAMIKHAEIDTHAGFSAFKGRATLLGLVGQLDPPRPEVAAAVRACHEAGIRTVMVTGDHKVTGLAIAKDLGLVQHGDRAVDGNELEAMPEAALTEEVEGISVFARVHPAQKLRIVEAYQRRGQVVAMTGDGVNDAPALARANVGIAMGITGTEVAKESSEIVIADDNFATIVAAIEEGRVVYRNIKKAVLLLFSTSAAEVALLMLAMLLGYPPPFAAVQILWNNLVTEGVITINLIMDPGEGDEMKQPPTSPDEPLLTRLLLRRLGLMATAIVASTLGWFLVRTSSGVATARVQTETFTLLAICEWFNVLNCRSERRSAFSLGLFKNRWLVGGLVVGNLLQLAVVFWTPLSNVFHTVAIGIREMLMLAAVGSSVLWVEELRKLIVRQRLRRSAAPQQVGR
jgi:Ca2+-transporting ATPase